MANWRDLLRQAAKLGQEFFSPSRRSTGTATRPPKAGRAPSSARTSATRDRALTVVYAPDPDGAADPGEIVWAWVPFEEDDGRGKDRPLLVVGRGRGELVGLMLSSRSDRDGHPDWVSVGSGAWDREGRESFVRLDRVLEIDEHDVRREGAVLDRDRFDRVAGELLERFGWR